MYQVMTHNLTLLDGEMVIDTLPGTKTQARRYLIYDLMVIGGITITEVSFFFVSFIIESYR